MGKKFNVMTRVQSFKYAFSGLWTLLSTQHNAWIHAVATLVVVTCGFIVRLSLMEWCVIVLAIIIVWMAEAFNTALEFLADVAHPDYHPLIKKVKDIAAGAVLLSAIGAAIVGGIVFWGKIVGF